MKNIGTIRNPLTIIAMFAGIAEISGTGVLPFITAENQSTYIWFLMLFPAFLVSLFFITLHVKHQVLYAPSDYQNEDNFLKSVTFATDRERSEKIEKEIAEDQTYSGSVASTQAPLTTEASGSVGSPMFSLRKNDGARSEYLLAEDLLMRKLGKEFSSDIRRGLRVSAKNSFEVIDGMVRDRGVTTLIEARLVRKSIGDAQVLGVLTRFADIMSLMPKEQSETARALIAFALDDGAIGYEEISNKVEKFRAQFRFPIDLRFYRFSDLRNEFSVGP